VAAAVYVPTAALSIQVGDAASAAVERRPNVAVVDPPAKSLS